ncbi:MAG: NifB/NifX family molybdenum-iron cluster-binding protein [Candidatus Asgardarchaeia archaeon]
MRIAVATQGAGGLDDLVSPIFGRAMSFTIVEVENNEIKNVEVHPNPAISAISGAGLQAAQILANLKVDVVIAGSFGPNASAALSVMGIQMIPGVAGVSVKEAVDKYISKEITPVSPATQQIPQVPQTTPMYPFTYPAMPYPFSKDDEIKLLESQIKYLEQQIELIDKRIKELKSKK